MATIIYTETRNWTFVYMWRTAKPWIMEKSGAWHWAVYTQAQSITQYKHSATQYTHIHISSFLCSVMYVGKHGLSFSDTGLVWWLEPCNMQHESKAEMKVCIIVTAFAFSFTYMLGLRHSNILSVHDWEVVNG